MMNIRFTIYDLRSPLLVGSNDSKIAHQGHEPKNAGASAVASWSAAVLCRCWTLVRCKSARRLAQSKTWRQCERFMERRMEFIAARKSSIVIRKSKAVQFFPAVSE
jgi:hypothetical protein